MTCWLFFTNEEHAEDLKCHIHLGRLNLEDSGGSMGLKPLDITVGPWNCPFTEC
jgi:hypothetical protein